MSHDAQVAYFSMEIALDAAIPTYSGGLGVLAGDTVRAAADLRVPMVAVTLLYHEGYFTQRIDEHGNQHEEPAKWEIGKVLEDTGAKIEVDVQGEKVRAKVWRYHARGNTGSVVPVLFLDAAVEENSVFGAGLTKNLYGGDHYYRLCQEILLGIGGVAALRALGFNALRRYHMNEGHAALLTLALFEEELERDSARALENVRQKCVFTTHTPVVAGHDSFPADMAVPALGEARWRVVAQQLGDHRLHMTELALHFSKFVNGVAMSHATVSRAMFPQHPIHAITNGVHAATWVASPMAELYDRYLLDWRSDAMMLHYARSIPHEELWKAHMQTKRVLFSLLHERLGVQLREEVLTLGFARRSTGYKRALLVLSDPERLRAIAQKYGGLQIVFAGKAHPRDFEGKHFIKIIHDRAKELSADVAIVYLPNYDVSSARWICAGCDVWLNTPRPPWEASGTSGMKAAMNGVPSLSVLDGWWLEGCVPGITGWPIGAADDGQVRAHDPNLDNDHAVDLYRRLDDDVARLYYKERRGFQEIMRLAIAINGSYFNTHRMVLDYSVNSYRL
jgi:starch phosphorylase